MMFIPFNSQYLQIPFQLYILVDIHLKTATNEKKSFFSNSRSYTAAVGAAAAAVTFQEPIKTFNKVLH